MFTSASHPPEEPDLRAERQMAMCAELAALGMDVARFAASLLPTASSAAAPLAASAHPKPNEPEPDPEHTPENPETAVAGKSFEEQIGYMRALMRRCVAEADDLRRPQPGENPDPRAPSGRPARATILFARVAAAIRACIALENRIATGPSPVIATRRAPGSSIRNKSRSPRKTPRRAAPTRPSAPPPPVFTARPGSYRAELLSGTTTQRIDSAAANPFRTAAKPPSIERPGFRLAKTPSLPLDIERELTKPAPRATSPP